MPKLDTTLIHAGEPRIGGAVSIPVFQTSIYEDQPEGESDYHDIRYIRLNNSPNHVALCAKLAAAEGGEAALVTTSGMAAISTALLTYLSAGDHVLIQDCTYGGTHHLAQTDLRALGIGVGVLGEDPSDWEAALRPETKVVFTEALTNPLLQIPDHPAITEFASRHGLVSLIDATMASPVNFRPLKHGYDVVLHSATKYLNGHSDIVAGAIVSSEAHIRRIKLKLDHFGGCLDPHAAALMHRGMKTMGLRVRRQNQTTHRLATLLAGHRAVRRVNWPGLAEHPDHQRAAWFDGLGGVLSFELDGGEAAARRLMSHLTLAIKAPSFGGVETLITRPAETSHAGVSPQERQRIGIGEGLVRVAVGIEDPDDLLADFLRALDTL